MCPEEKKKKNSAFDYREEQETFNKAFKFFFKVIIICAFI